MSIEPVSAIAASMASQSVNLSQLGMDPAQGNQGPLTQALPVQAPTFSQLLLGGLRDVESRLANADSVVQRFALDDTVPVHQVAIALEEAQLSVELAMQVRARLLESFRDIMNMQI